MRIGISDTQLLSVTTTNNIVHLIETDFSFKIRLKISLYSSPVKRPPTVHRVEQRTQLPGAHPVLREIG